MTSPRVLLLPGWQNCGPDHWQSRWERQHGWQRVEQDDWHWPRRGDWMAQLDDTVLALAGHPIVLVAHSLGCHLVAAWAAHTRHAGRVRGALLVDPPDTERDDVPPQLFNWRPMVRRRLPFPAVAALSTNDPFASHERAAALAADWGARTVTMGAAGHLNASSGLGDWPAGLALLEPWLHPLPASRG